MGTEPGPNVRRRQLGRQLRDLRNAAKLTMEEAAEQSGLSRATISRIESAKQAILPRNVRLLCQVYDIGAPLLGHLVQRAEESDDSGWWVTYSDTVPDWFERFAGEEVEASEIWAYEAEFVPGLLQTADYCREITLASGPNITEEDQQRWVTFRQSRQERLDTADPVQLIAVLNEAVIRRVVGSADLMRAQLLRLLEFAERPNITLQVLPFSAGAHPAMTNSFTILRFPDDDCITTIFVEVDSGGIYPDRPPDLHRYTWVFQRLRELALSSTETTALISRVMREL